MNDAIKWLETGFERTLQEIFIALKEFEAIDGEGRGFASPNDIPPTDYLYRFKPVGYVRRGSVFFSIKEDNEVGISL